MEYLDITAAAGTPIRVATVLIWFSCSGSYSSRAEALGIADQSNFPICNARELRALTPFSLPDSLPGQNCQFQSGNFGSYLASITIGNVSALYEAADCRFDLDSFKNWGNRQRLRFSFSYSCQVAHKSRKWRRSCRWFSDKRLDLGRERAVHVLFKPREIFSCSPLQIGCCRKSPLQVGSSIAF
jgi:hypothetical protein